MSIEAKDIIIPVSSAFLASLLTHIFALKRTRAELLVKERANAFSELHRKLVEILRYCRARANEETGADFAETTDILAANENKSPLEHLHDFRACIDRDFIFYPKKLRAKFPEFEERIRLMCSHELRCAADPHAPLGATGHYYDSLMNFTISLIENVNRSSPLR